MLEDGRLVFEEALVDELPRFEEEDEKRDLASLFTFPLRRFTKSVTSSACEVAGTNARASAARVSVVLVIMLD